MLMGFPGGSVGKETAYNAGAETFHPDPNWKNFQKPGTWRGSLDESSLGFGYPKFISHQDIRKRNYVRDDAVFIRASVELPRKILS